MTDFAPGLICDVWKLTLPDFRGAFHQSRPNWERGRLESVHERLKPGMLVFDIGAEHGDFTALYRSWGAEVVPIEPSEPYWPCIRRTFEANGFEPPPAWFNGFAADADRWGLDENWSLEIPAGDGWPGCSKGPVVADFGFRHLAQDEKTPRIQIDTLARFAGKPDALMIDVEGAEWHVLRGALRTLTTGNVLVWVSVHHDTMADWYNRTRGDITTLMASCGYSGTLLPAHGEAEEFWLYERVA